MTRTAGVAGEVVAPQRGGYRPSSSSSSEAHDSDSESDQSGSELSGVLGWVEEWTQAANIDRDDIILRFLGSPGLLAVPPTQVAKIFSVLSDNGVSELIIREARWAHSIAWGTSGRGFSSMIEYKPKDLEIKLHFLFGAMGLKPSVVDQYPFILRRGLWTVLGPRLHYLMLRRPDLYQGEEWHDGDPKWVGKAIQAPEKYFSEVICNTLPEQFMVFREEWSATVGQQLLDIRASGKSSAALMAHMMSLSWSNNLESFRHQKPDQQQRQQRQQLQQRQQQLLLLQKQQVQQQQQQQHQQQPFQTPQTGRFTPPPRR